MRSLEFQGYTWRPRITSNRSKLQRPDRVTVCSHSAKDATANVKTTLSISHTSGPVTIALLLNIDKKYRGRAPETVRIVMKYAGFGGNAGRSDFLQSNRSLWQGRAHRQYLLCYVPSSVSQSCKFAIGIARENSKPARSEESCRGQCQRRHLHPTAHSRSILHHRPRRVPEQLPTR